MKEVRLCGPLSDELSVLHGCKGNRVWQQDPDSNFRTGPEPFSFEAFQVAIVVKNPSANAEDTRNMGLIPGLGRSLEEEVATHSSILARRTPWAEKPGRLQSMGSQESDMT